ncbi:hypothetical protein [Gaopeijia maritima]|uniref:Uncharacterized protein n=1 Tax=Gaopeijia maritima TaxID=3119007 RepID=A0ABU9E7D5_9BACT
MTPTLDTLEPLIDAVRDGVSAAGWTLSGLQKTTSYEFEGRWEGDSTRSAYLFFHREGVEEASVDVYLDETSRGLQGNLALVLDLPGLAELPAIPELLTDLGERAGRHLPDGYRTPVTVRLRLRDAPLPADRAELEARLKLVLPRAAIDAGASAVAAVCSATVAAFDGLLADPALPR